MLSFTEFTNEVVASIGDYLPDKFKDATITTDEILKNNNTRKIGLLISDSSKSNGCVPTIYLDGFYEEYNKGISMVQILTEIAQVRVENEMPMPFDTNQITDFNLAKHNIIPRLLNAATNADFLLTIPHQTLEDLAIVYTIVIKGEDSDIFGTVVITNDILNKWGISVDELHELSVENMSEMCPPHMEHVLDVLHRMLRKKKDISSDFLEFLHDIEYPESHEMYVVTTPLDSNGAAAILDKNFMKTITEKFENFYIIPSSIHEVLIVPYNEDMNMTVDMFKDMVREVNTNELSASDFLSNNIYTYSNEGGLRIATQ